MGRVYFGGLPTEVDVRALWERFGVPVEGQAIPYADVEAVCKSKHGTHRHQTVTTAWRRRLFREHNVLLVAGQGMYTACDPTRRVEFGATKLRTGARAFRRAHVVVSSTDLGRLSPEQRKQADHILMTTATAIQSARIAARKSQPVLPEAVGG
jgi:hypothetical protein